MQRRESQDLTESKKVTRDFIIVNVNSSTALLYSWLEIVDN